LTKGKGMSAWRPTPHQIYELHGFDTAPPEHYCPYCAIQLKHHEKGTLRLHGAIVLQALGAAESDDTFQVEKFATAAGVAAVRVTRKVIHIPHPGAADTNKGQTPAGQPGSLGKTPAVPPTEGSPSHGLQGTGLPRPEEPRWTSITGQKPDTAAASEKPINFYRVGDVEAPPPQENKLDPQRVAAVVEKIRRRDMRRKALRSPYHVEVK
jgi:hypothetical protein